MQHYLLIYQVSPDYLARRASFRHEHLLLAKAASDAGHLLAGGAVGDPIDSAMLLFQADDPTVVATFARQDPYVIHGLVTDWQIKPWHTVAGALALSPVVL